MNSQAAIQKSLSQISGSKTAALAEARLVSYSNYLRLFSRSDSESQGPVWIVGILSDGLTVGDITGDPKGHPHYSQSKDPVSGSYLLWDANSGELIGSGVLDQDLFERIREIDSEDLPIVPATPWT